MSTTSFSCQSEPAKQKESDCLRGSANDLTQFGDRCKTHRLSPAQEIRRVPRLQHAMHESCSTIAANVSPYALPSNLAASFVSATAPDMSLETSFIKSANSPEFLRNIFSFVLSCLTSESLQYLDTAAWTRVLFVCSTPSKTARNRFTEMDSIITEQQLLRAASKNCAVF
jgi:hypothetical protein